MTSYAVVVVGGGAAGLMAAGQAAGLGVSTLVLEKMPRPARKLRITGKGRCNLTNMAALPDFIARFGPNGRFLRQAFAQFFTPDLIAFLHTLGLHTVTERGGRVFPDSNQAQDVVDILVQWALAQGAHIQTGAAVQSLTVEDGRITGAITRSGQVLTAQAVVLAAGGASYPATGSTGDGYKMAYAVGHTIMPIRPALVPLETEGDTALRLQGLSLRNVQASLWVDGRKQAQESGEMLFTHFGVSGPIILTMSKVAVDALRADQSVSLSIHLKPALSRDELDARLLRDLDQGGKKQYQTLLKELLPAKLIPICIEQTDIPAERVGHQITAAERKRLLVWLGDFRLKITGHRSFDEAIITAGGVDVREIDPRTMASRRVAGLYLAGEVIDIDADTGGYNLQAAFSTGWVAGRAAAGYVKGGE